MTAPEIEKLKALALAASPGPWQWWTSNSTLRLTGLDGKDGGVLHAYVHSGWADISCSAENRAFIEAFNPATAKALLDERAALIAEVERLKADRLTFRTGYEIASNRCVELEDEVARLRRRVGGEPAAPGVIRPGVGEEKPLVERRRYLDGGME